MNFYYHIHNGHFTYFLTFSKLNALCMQDFPQFSHLFLEFSDDFGIWIFIDHSLTYNLLGSVSISNTERTQKKIQVLTVQCIFQHLFYICYCFKKIHHLYTKWYFIMMHALNHYYILLKTAHFIIVVSC